MRMNLSFCPSTIYFCEFLKKILSVFLFFVFVLVDVETDVVYDVKQINSFIKKEKILWEEPKVALIVAPGLWGVCCQLSSGCDWSLSCVSSWVPPSTGCCPGGRGAAPASAHPPAHPPGLTEAGGSGHLLPAPELHTGNQLFIYLFFLSTQVRYEKK